jgi:5-methylcytosine-specific restriction endonuclease McrA
VHKYKINPEDEEWPVRYKNYRREHRVDRRFSRRTKERAHQNAGGKCEDCSIQLKFESATFHHILSLSYAFHYFPEISNYVLKSELNCRVLCNECHIKIHKNDCLAVYTAIAANLLNMIETWEEQKHSISTEC